MRNMPMLRMGMAKGLSTQASRCLPSRFGRKAQCGADLDSESRILSPVSRLTS